MATDDPFRPLLDEENPYAAPEAELGPAGLGGDDVEPTEAELIRNRHLGREASIRSLGLLYCLSGALVGIIGAFILAVGFGGLEDEEVPESFGAVVIGFGILYLLFGPALWMIGRGLRNFRPWARWAAVGLTGLGVLTQLLGILAAGGSPEEAGATAAGALIGMLIPACILYLLLSEQAGVVFAPSYKAIIAETPHVRSRTSCIVWGFLILLGGVVLLAVIGAIVGSAMPRPA